MTFYIYGYFIDGCAEPFYIGKGSGPRAYEHLRPSRYNSSNTRFYNKIRSLLRSGITPIIKIIFDNLTESEAFELEKELISKYGRLDLKTGCLCNHTDGGEGMSGNVPTPETRAKISGVKLMKFAGKKQFLGHIVHGGRTKERDVKARNTLQQRYGKPIESYNLITGDTIKEYPSIGSVVKDGFNFGKVSEVVNGKREHHKYLGWRFT